MLRLASLLLLNSWLAVLISASSLQADFVVVTGDAPSPIVVSEDADPQIVGMATKLAEYLSKITGEDFKVHRTDAPHAIRLVIDPKSKLPAEGYAWTASDDQLTIEASSVRGLAYGVYAFLEQECGCRWWSFNEEDVPSNPKLAITNQTVQYVPPFKMHDLFNREAQTPENDFHFKSGGDSQLQFTGGHTLYPLLHEYGQTHPEIYPADATGKRAPNDLHLCYLAPGIAEALTSVLDSEVQRRNGNVTDYIYFAGMGDWYDGQCQCEKCKAVYEEEKWTNPDGTVLPGYTGTLLRMINVAAEALEKKYPGIRVGTFAYMSLEAPPAITKPRENVVIRVPRLRHCTVHAANECQGNRGFYHNLRRWQELAPGRVHVWDYGANFMNFLLPFPTLNSMAENIKFYHEQGIAGVMIQGNYVSTGGDAAVMKNYVWRKLLREPGRSTKELTEEFCHGYYGPAGKDVLAYMSALENSVRVPELKHADEFASPANVYLNEELLVVLREHLLHALEATQVEQHKDNHRRVQELQVSIEAAALWNSGPLEQKSDRLVRTDLGEFSYERALALVEHSRRVSPKEQGEGRLFREQFLQLHGGPTATLKSREVALTAAPVQAGKMGPITFQGATVITQTSVQPAKGATIYKFDQQPTGSELTLSGECGIAHWQPTAHHLAVLNVKLTEAGLIEMTGLLERLQQGAASAPAVVSTTYPLDNKADAEVQWQNAEGTWATVKLNAEASTVTCAHLVAIKFKQQVALKAGISNVEVLDSYATAEPIKAAPFKGTLSFDATNGTLTTSVQTELSEIRADAPQPYLKRTLSITAVK